MDIGQLRDSLHDLLRRVTVSVVVDGRPMGSAFFIDDDLLLTCEHVVTHHRECEVVLVDGTPMPASVVGEPDKATDVALLRVATADRRHPQPCVALDVLVSPGEYLLAGFPRADDDEGLGFEIVDVHARPRETLDDGISTVQLDEGVRVRPGMSGGPVVNLRTGAVVGVVRLSRNPDDAAGGGAVPVERAARVLDPVDLLTRRSTPAVRRWREVIGRDRWGELGRRRSWDVERELDLTVRGERRRWTITTGLPGETPHHVSGSDLGEDVAEALFRWAAQRRRIHGREEVELLGRLLGRGLVPDGAVAQLQRVAEADLIHVRFHTEPGNDLADIPWELAAIPGLPTKFLAAEDGFVFSRVDCDPQQSSPRAPVTDDAVEVLAVLAQPSRWVFPNVYGRNGDRPYEWPELDRMEKALAECTSGAPFKTNLLVCPEPGDVEDQLENGEYGVFHFVGVGKLGSDGTPLMAFVVDDGETESWHEVTRILELARNTGVRLVVLEFLLPPDHHEFDPVTPSRIGPLVAGATEAVVLTQQPVHPKQLQAFNRSFYRSLREGRSVEYATQLARRRMATNNPVEDEAGFGWFAVVTAGGGQVYLTREDSGSDSGLPPPGRLSSDVRTR